MLSAPPMYGLAVEVVGSTLQQLCFSYPLLTQSPVIWSSEPAAFNGEEEEAPAITAAIIDDEPSVQHSNSAMDEDDDEEEWMLIPDEQSMIHSWEGNWRDLQQQEGDDSAVEGSVVSCPGTQLDEVAGTQIPSSGHREERDENGAICIYDNYTDEEDDVAALRGLQRQDCFLFDGGDNDESGSSDAFVSSVCDHGAGVVGGKKKAPIMIDLTQQSDNDDDDDLVFSVCADDGQSRATGKKRKATTYQQNAAESWTKRRKTMASASSSLPSGLENEEEELSSTFLNICLDAVFSK